MKQLSLNPEYEPPPYAGHCKFCDEPITYIVTCENWPGTENLTRFLCKEHGERHEANSNVLWTLRKRTQRDLKEKK